MILAEMLYAAGALLVKCAIYSEWFTQSSAAIGASVVQQDRTSPS